jgi:hypothetical protein
MPESTPLAMCRPNPFHLGNVLSSPWLDAALKALEQGEKLIAQTVVVEAALSLVEEAGLLSRPHQAKPPMKPSVFSESRHYGTPHLCRPAGRT